jgi:hypothetical protein
MLLWSVACRAPKSLVSPGTMCGKACSQSGLVHEVVCGGANVNHAVASLDSVLRLHVEYRALEPLIDFA